MKQHVNISRRFFIGGLLSAAAMGPRRLFAATPGAFADGKPNLAFGVLSDVHIGLAKGGQKLTTLRSTKYLEKALTHFRDSGVHAVVIAGDITNDGLYGELKAVAGVWYRVFPNDRAPDGHKVERIFVFGNHDWDGIRRGAVVYDDKAKIKAEALSTDPRKAWDDCFHDEWSEFFTREVNGYRFVGANWCVGSGKCNGVSETFISGLSDRYAALKGKIDPSLPFFHVQHPHPRGTVHGNNVWGQDDGESTRILSSCQNAIAFSGHSHSSLLDEKSIWQGAFTSVGTSTLQNVGPGGIACGLKGGYENYETKKSKAKGLGAHKMMPAINLYEGKQGQIVRVYGDRLVFSRRDFFNDVPLCDDLVMPLPAAESRPFEFASRAASLPAPAFAPGAELAICLTKAKARGAKKKSPPRPCVEIAIPPANAEPRARCVRYEINAKGHDGKDLKVAILSEAFRFASTDKRVQSPAKCRIALDRLSAGDIAFSVTAYSSWGKASTPLVATFSPAAMPTNGKL